MKVAGWRVRLFTISANGDWLGLRFFFLLARISAIGKYNSAILGQISSRAECQSSISVFCGTINPTALRSIKRHFFAVHGVKILPEKLTKVLKKITKTPDNRKIPTNGMTCLSFI